MRSLEEVLIFVDELNLNLGDPLYYLISNLKERDPQNRILTDDIIIKDQYWLALDSENDFFIVKEDGTWKRANYDTEYGIGYKDEHTHAIYVERNGEYVVVVGDFTTEKGVNNLRQLPPL